MLFNQKTLLCFYKKLLTLYPPAFREKFGESMEQTFNDICNERQKLNFSFCFWYFGETSLGIISENFADFKRGKIMENIFSNLKVSAFISFLLVLPWTILEWVNRQTLPQFPIPLFVFLWLLPMMFLLILLPIVQNIKTGNDFIGNPVFFLLKVAIMFFIIWEWGQILIDQMPCFMGVPNCD